MGTRWIGQALEREDLDYIANMWPSAAILGCAVDCWEEQADEAQEILCPYLDPEVVTDVLVIFWLDYCNMPYKGLPLESIWKLQLVGASRAVYL